MKNRWVIVSTEGLDSEELPRPRTQELECPSCDRLVRFVEKQLVRNLKVFGVPLLGVERGRRVLECPSCRACVEPPEGLAEEPDDDERLRLRAQVQQARDEHWLWKRRAEMAVERGDDELAVDALRMAKRAAAELERLESELSRGGRVGAGKGGASSAKGESAVEAPARPRPVVVARPSPTGGVVETHDDAFAALKNKVAKREADEAARDQAGYAERMADLAEQKALREAEIAEQNESIARREAAAHEAAAQAPAAAPVQDAIEDDFAALKAKLAGRAGGAAPAALARGAGAAAADGDDETAALKARLSGRGAPASKTAPASTPASTPEATPAPIAPPAAVAAPSAPAVVAAPAAPVSVDDDFAALKARIASRAPSPDAAPKDASAYEALRREMSAPAPAPAPAPAQPSEPAATPVAAPAAAPASSPAPDDDDPVAALKRKLRGR